MTKILNRFTNNLICEEELLNIKEIAIKNKANLHDANLSGADLDDAGLSCADLSGADLHRANLRGANLCGANLHGADLSGADLHRANLHGADLSGADLHRANLRDANLRGADLSNADLRGAKLYGAKNINNLEWTNQARQQILFIFRYQPLVEIEGLRQKIIDGKINGTQYKGECCCLIGSLGNDKAVSHIPFYTKGLHNVAEQLFFQIKEGDKPETNIFSKIALELCDQFLDEWLKSLLKARLCRGSVN